MYKKVNELRQEEIDELKNRIIIDRDDDYNGFKSILENEQENNGLTLTYEEWEIINLAFDEDDIPNELIYKIYKGTLFVDEDFWCNI